MKKILLVLFALIAMAGCSQNELTVKNRAAGSIYFVIRGEEHHISSGATKVIEKIPDGTFEYNTTYSLPPNVTKFQTKSGLTGEMDFEDHGTKGIITYSSYFEGTDSSKTYFISAVKSSNISTEKDE